MNVSAASLHDAFKSGCTAKVLLEAQCPPNCFERLKHLFNVDCCR